KDPLDGGNQCFARCGIRKVTRLVEDLPPDRLLNFGGSVAELAFVATAQKQLDALSRESRGNSLSQTLGSRAYESALSLDFEIHACLSLIPVADCLGFGEELQAVTPAFAPDSACFLSAERSSQITGEPAIHPDDAVFEAGRNPVAAVNVRTPQAFRQFLRGGDEHLQHLLLPRERRHSEDRGGQ